MKLFLFSCAGVLGVTGLIYILLPLFTQVHKRDRITAVADTLRSIHTSQAQYQTLHGRFGTLKELANAGLIGPNLASGKSIAGYVYSDSLASADAYCIHANRMNDSVETRDFNISEDGRIRYHSSPAKSTVLCRTGELLGNGDK